MRCSPGWLLLVGVLSACQSAPLGTLVGPPPVASSARQLTFSPSNDFSPVWSPDGRSILYVSDQTGTWNVWEISVQGTAPHALTFDQFQYSSPSFTPDGLGIVVASDRGSPTPKWTDLWLLDRQGTVERRLISQTISEKEFLPAVSHDGRLLAYLNLPMNSPPQYRLMVSALPGGIPRMVTDNRVIFAPLRFSPDNHQILFTSDRMGNADVWVMDLDGGGAHALTTSPSVDTTGDWSPDGSTIVFVSNQSGTDELWLMDAHGQNRRQLTRDGSLASSPSFSPDGAWVVYVSTKTGNQDLWIIPSGLPTRNPA